MPPTNRTVSVRDMPYGMGTIAVGVLAVALIAALVGVVALIQQHRHQQTVERTRTVAAATIEEVRNTMQQVRTLTAEELRAMRRYLNPVHLKHARQYGVARPDSREETQRLVDEGQLVEIEANAYYDIAPLDYSVAAVTPDTRNVLELVGQQFQARLDTLGLPPYRFQVTSATRTLEDQRNLRRINANAAQNSAHNFGTTVDLHYARFDIPPEAVPVPKGIDLDTDLYREIVTPALEELAQTRHDVLKAQLGRVILNLQDQGKLVVVHERRQPVYHFTVAAEIPEPAFPAGTVADDPSRERPSTMDAHAAEPPLERQGASAR